MIIFFRDGMDFQTPKTRQERTKLLPAEYQLLSTENALLPGKTTSGLKRGYEMNIMTITLRSSRPTVKTQLHLSSPETLAVQQFRSSKPIKQYRNLNNNLNQESNIAMQKQRNTQLHLLNSHFSTPQAQDPKIEPTKAKN